MYFTLLPYPDGPKSSLAFWVNKLRDNADFRPGNDALGGDFGVGYHDESSGRHVGVRQRQIVRNQGLFIIIEHVDIDYAGAPTHGCRAFFLSPPSNHSSNGRNRGGQRHRKQKGAPAAQHFPFKGFRPLCGQRNHAITAAGPKSLGEEERTTAASRRCRRPRKSFD